MNRRTYLAALPALTAGTGCLDLTTRQGSAGGNALTVSVSKVQRGLLETVENATDGERLAALAFGVNIERDAITPDATARVALEYGNEGDESFTLNINPDEPDHVSSVGDDPGLVLLSDEHDLTRRTDTCWKPQEDVPGRERVGYQHPVEPGDTETLEYGVWAAPRQRADCIQPGAYGFETLYGSFELTVEE